MLLLVDVIDFPNGAFQLAHHKPRDPAKADWIKFLNRDSFRDPSELALLLPGPWRRHHMGAVLKPFINGALPAAAERSSTVDPFVEPNRGVSLQQNKQLPQ